MKLIKKIFNKILFAVVVALVFTMVNRCKVKALISNVSDINPDAAFRISISDVWNMRDDLDWIAQNTSSNWYSYAFFLGEDNALYRPKNSICIGGGFAYNPYCLTIDYLDSYINFSQPVYWGTLNPSSNGGITAVFISNHLPTLTYSNGTTYIEATDNVILFDVFTPIQFGTGPDVFLITPEVDNSVNAISMGTITSNSVMWNSNTNWEYMPSATISNPKNYNFSLAPPHPIVEFEEKNYRVDGWVVGIELLTKITNYSPDFLYNTSWYYKFVPTGGEFANFPYNQLYSENIMNIEGVGNFTYIAKESGTFYFRWEDDLSDDFGVYQYPVEGIASGHVASSIDISVSYNSSNDLIIDEILLDTTYNVISFNSSGYKCYYKFEEDEENPINQYIEVGCSSGRLYVAHSNGVYYAMIKKYNNDTEEWETEVIKQQYVYNYGKLVSEVYKTNSSGIFGKLLGGTNSYLGFYNNNEGSLKSIVLLPLRLGTFVYQFFNSSNTCSPYDMGTIFGRHLIINCVDLSILGSPLLNTIDIIFAGFFSITWGLFLYKLFRKIVLLRDLSVTGLFKGGIF